MNSVEKMFTQCGGFTKSIVSTYTDMFQSASPTIVNDFTGMINKNEAELSRRLASSEFICLAVGRLIATFLPVSDITLTNYISKNALKAVQLNRCVGIV